MTYDQKFFIILAIIGALFFGAMMWTESMDRYHSCAQACFSDGMKSLDPATGKCECK